VGEEGIIGFPVLVFHSHRVARERERRDSENFSDLFAGAYTTEYIVLLEMKQG
jgi:hypothetical protein